MPKSIRFVATTSRLSELFAPLSHRRVPPCAVISLRLSSRALELASKSVHPCPNCCVLVLSPAFLRVSHPSTATKANSHQHVLRSVHPQHSAPAPHPSPPSKQSKHAGSPSASSSSPSACQQPVVLLPPCRPGLVGVLPSPS